MPRHPPCALQHFTHNKHAQTTKPDTKRCSHPLCNTQHTTTHQHPQPPTNPHNKRYALDGQGRKRHQENPHPPARCLLRTQQRAEPVPQLLVSCSTQPHPTTCTGCGNNKKETHDHMPRACPPIRGSSLERRCSSRTFRYGYLVTTSSQSPVPPSTTPPHKWVR